MRVCNRNRMVHFLVLIAFTGMPPAWGKYKARHANGNRADNRYENLVWSGRMGKRPAVIEDPLVEEYESIIAARYELIELMQT